MSNVLARLRSVSELEFYKNGADIRANATRLLMNENRVPKRWRPVFTFPGIDLARRLMDEIIAAYIIYPTTEYELDIRREHQNCALIICEQLIQHFQWLIDTLSLEVIGFEIIVGMIDKEIELLKAWRKQDKVFRPETGLET